MIRIRTTICRALALTAVYSLSACSDDGLTPVADDLMMNEDSQPIVVEQVYEAPASEVWSAITDKTKMPQWFFEPIADFEPRVGFETRFTVDLEDASYEHLWRIVDVVPEQRIVYEWRYGGLPGNSTVTWELSPAPPGTKLKLTHVVHESFPDDDPAFTREAGVAGWQYFIQESLKAYLDGQD